MRILIPCLLLCLAISTQAKEWKNEIFHCTANIPDSAGWQTIDAPPAPGIAPVLTMQNVSRHAVFGISVVEKYRDANLADPAIQMDLEAMLRQFGYQFVGHSSVSAGGFSWLQYPVRAGSGPQQVSGVIRYASAGGYVFGITMLRGGGQEASQDVELQQAAASFRIIPAAAFSPDATPPAGQPANGTRKASPATGARKANDATAPAAQSEDGTAGEDNTNARMIWAGGAALLVLLFFIGIIARTPAQRG